ncbi:hypothetical protein [Mesorhizobium sp.]|nr:hypothetical protein [Mesorhizobium sp.]TIN05832.1 MAG: hypothetical protein E5Y14_31615 [Mesorhizobium sp.]
MNDTIAKRVEFAHLLDEAIALGKVIRFGGVLVDDLTIQSDFVIQVVRFPQLRLVGAKRGQPMIDMDASRRRAVAAHDSEKVAKSPAERNEAPELISTQCQRVGVPYCRRPRFQDYIPPRCGEPSTEIAMPKKALADTLAARETIYVNCAHPMCCKSTKLDIQALIDRLGRDHGPMHDDLVGLFICSNCKAAGGDRRQVFFYEGQQRARNRDWKPTF